MNNSKKNYLFTSESVSEGHPDKVADQISDAILDQFLAFENTSHVACETLVTTGQVVIAGEVNSEVYVNLDKLVRDVIEKIGYNDSRLGFDARSCGVLNALHSQSSDINQGVSRAEGEQGAGDQGMMFGYACNETPNLMPLTIDLSHKLMYTLAQIRHTEPQMMPYLRPDAKAQVTVEYDGETRRPVHIDTIVVSTQHDEFITPDDDTNPDSVKAAEQQMQERILQDVRGILIPTTLETYSDDVRRLYDNNTRVLVNPTGKFVIGGPNGDTGLTGRKIIVDTYGGRGAHGGGAFSGKDPSKVDRSAAYACRHIALNAVAAGIADEMLLQVSYAIGEAQPVSFNVNTFGTSHVPQSDGEIAQILSELFDMRPAAIISRLKLLNPIYSETAAYGHMGRKSETVVKEFVSTLPGHAKKSLAVELFTWEKRDMVDVLRAAFALA